MRRVTDPPRVSNCQQGFTLVEMIISIVITGIVVSMIALFGRNQIGAYLDAGNRAELADAADTAVRRIARDLQGALPNSVRVSAAGDFLEFVPIRDAGRYRAELTGAGGGDPLDFNNGADNTFDVLGPGVTVNAGDQLVIYNLGLLGSDVYAGSNRKALSVVGSGLTTLSFTMGGAQFQFASPQNRFQIVGAPVTYECAANAATPQSGTVIRHGGYGFQPAVASTPWALGGAASVLITDVSACRFDYTPAVLQRNGLAVLRLTLERNGESVEILHQVDVLNTP
ncbi:type II secretion system protein J [Dechloromonas sp. ARDL1]